MGHVEVGTLITHCHSGANESPIISLIEVRVGGSVAGGVAR